MSTQPEITHEDRRYALLLDEIYAEMGRHRLSQVGLAARLGVTQPWVNRRLKGHTVMTWPELDAVARVLDVTLTELSRRVDAAETSSSGGDKTGWFRRHRAVISTFRHRGRVTGHPHNHRAIARAAGNVYYLPTQKVG